MPRPSAPAAGRHRADSFSLVLGDVNLVDGLDPDHSTFSAVGQSLAAGAGCRVPDEAGPPAGDFWMNPGVTSVFDLSPAEKLQLVEDLWDDLAASPDAVPIHDWQKEELARRKANLMRNPATGLSWEEVKVKRKLRSRHGR
jgi:putative addiction module component (TIGR02574 family)